MRLNGLTPYDEVPDFLAAADVFATASTSEVHPLVVMEAMAAGLPAIGIHSPGVGDIIDDGITGFLTNPDAEEFARRDAGADEGRGAEDPHVRSRRTHRDDPLRHPHHRRHDPCALRSLIAERAAKPKSDA